MVGVDTLKVSFNKFVKAPPPVSEAWHDEFSGKGQDWITCIRSVSFLL